MIAVYVQGLEDLLALLNSKVYIGKRSVILTTFKCGTPLDLLYLLSN